MQAGRQLTFKGTKGWGGKRRGAGRPNRSGTVGHSERQAVDFKKPLHLTLRLADGMVNIRTRTLLEAFRGSVKGARSHGFRVLHFSILRNHIHILVECASNESLAQGMRSLGCRFGKAVRKRIGGVGPVFKGRYHLHVLTTPLEVKRALEYVILNRAKHENLIPHFDEYSTAAHFGQWKELLGRKMGPILAEFGRPISLPDYLSPPGSWLARVGWMKAVGS